MCPIQNKDINDDNEDELVLPDGGNRPDITDLLARHGSLESTPEEVKKRKTESDKAMDSLFS